MKMRKRRPKSSNAGQKRRMPSSVSQRAGNEEESTKRVSNASPKMVHALRMASMTRKRKAGRRGGELRRP